MTGEHQAVAATPPSASSQSEAMESMPIQTQAERQREEMTMLIAGFLTGMSIAGVFLIYIVLEFAKLLP